MDQLTQEQTDLIVKEIGIDGAALIYYSKTPVEYLSAAHSRYWDTPSEWAVFQLDDANEGIVIYGKYKRGWNTPWSSRHLVRVLLEELGHPLPLPQPQSAAINR